MESVLIRNNRTIYSQNGSQELNKFLNNKGTKPKIGQIGRDTYRILF